MGKGVTAQRALHLARHHTRHELVEAVIAAFSEPDGPNTIAGHFNSRHLVRGDNYGGRLSDNYDGR